jgi:6-pyruvoyltetrahydropterin/6-carboxytetrahydropterin synthase
MSYLISKEFHFSASHQLDHLPPDHKCHRLHGHNYVVRITCASEELDSRGFVIEYSELDTFEQWLMETVDHRHLNDVFPSMITSAENLAREFYKVCKEELKFPVRAVAVAETPRTWAIYQLAPMD